MPQLLPAREVELEPTRPGLPLGTIFLVFLRMGAFAFGGVYSMIAFFERELVVRRRWITAEELAEGVAIGQMTPGPPIVNTGAFVAYRLRGAPGAVVATVGQVLPGLAVVLAVAIYHDGFRSDPRLAGALRGVGAAAVGVVAAVALRMGRRAIDGRPAALVAVGAFALLALARANPLLVLGLGALAGWLVHGRRR